MVEQSVEGRCAFLIREQKNIFGMSDSVFTLSANRRTAMSAAEHLRLDGARKGLLRLAKSIWPTPNPRAAAMPGLRFES
jgi:hypothetical protein